MDTDAFQITVQPGRFDFGAARSLLCDGRAAFASGARVLVVDLSGVGFIDALGASVLATIQERAPHGARVLVTSLGSYARTVAEVTDLAHRLDLAASPSRRTARPS